MPRIRHLLIASAAQLGLVATASAYDPHTHAWLTRKAAERLVHDYPGKYGELLQFVDDVSYGALDEDNLLLDGDSDPFTIRGMRHFFRPTDGMGLFYGGQQFPSSYQWGYVGSDGNEWDWQDGLAAWRRGDKKTFYTIAGHMAHFIEDCTVPAHTHLDPHGPPDGDDFENWAAARTSVFATHPALRAGAQMEASLPLPPDSAKIPLFVDAWDAWQSTAWASYWRNMYPGQFDMEAHQASGLVTEMYPDLGWNYLYGDFNISEPPVGVRGTNYWQELNSFVYFKRTAYAPAIDRVIFDPAQPDVPGPGQFGPRRGEAMVDGFGEDLVPFAVLQAAGVMKLYLDQGYALTVETPAPEPTQTIENTGCSIADARGTGDAPHPPVLFIWGLMTVIVLRRNS